MKKYICLILFMTACGRAEFGDSSGADSIVSTSDDERKSAEENDVADGNGNNVTLEPNDPNAPDDAFREGVQIDAAGFDTFDVYAAMADREASFVFSPHGLGKSLLTLHAATSADTRVALDSQFAFDGGDAEFFYDAFAELDSRTGDGVSEFAVTGVWIDSDFDIAQNYIDTIDLFFDVAVRRVNLSEVETARVQINNTLRTATDGYVTEVFPSNSLPSGNFVVAGATFFNAPWQDAFDSIISEPLLFTADDGSQNLREFMVRSGSVLAQNDGIIQSVALPLTSGQSVILLLPNEGIAALESQLDLDFVLRVVDQMQVVDTSVVIPTIDLSTRFDLRTYAETLGSDFLFDEGATFGGAGTDVEFGSLVQFSRLSFDQEGVEDIEPMTDPGGNTLRFDRPFVFVVLDIERSSVLYLGRILD